LPSTNWRVFCDLRLLSADVLQVIKRDLRRARYSLEIARAIAPLAPTECGRCLPIGRARHRGQDRFHARQQSLGAAQELVELRRHPLRNGSRR
jgi:hypothetical protein